MPTEADTCRTYIVPNLHTSGWDDEYITEQMVLTRGRMLYVDNVQALLPSVLDRAFKGEL